MKLSDYTENAHHNAMLLEQEARRRKARRDLAEWMAWWAFCALFAGLIGYFIAG
jgi:hypothetical protein